MLERNNSIALMIDMQERLVPAMLDHKALTANTIKLLKGLSTFKIPALVSQQYTKGLGDTIPEIKQEIPDFNFYEKKVFSAADVPELQEALALANKKYIFVFGIESHVCVLQTCLGLLNLGYKPVLITDCISSRKQYDKDMAIQRLSAQGVIMSTYESVLFEMLQSAESPEFKEISKIIR